MVPPYSTNGAASRQKQPQCNNQCCRTEQDLEHSVSCVRVRSLQVYTTIEYIYCTGKLSCSSCYWVLLYRKSPVLCLLQYPAASLDYRTCSICCHWPPYVSPNSQDKTVYSLGVYLVHAWRLCKAATWQAMYSVHGSIPSLCMFYSAQQQHHGRSDTWLSQINYRCRKTLPAAEQHTGMLRTICVGFLLAPTFSVGSAVSDNVEW